MRSTFLLVPTALALALGGCSAFSVFSSPDPDQAQLALACETSHCDCRPPKKLSLRAQPSEPVQWRSDGSAFCRPGWLLNRAEE
jgi:hypothetical protein